MAPILPYYVLKLMYLDKCYTHICRNIYLPFNLSPSLYLSLYISIYLFIYLSIYLSIYRTSSISKQSHLCCPGYVIGEWPSCLYAERQTGAAERRRHWWRTTAYTGCPERPIESWIYENCLRDFIFISFFIEFYTE